MKVWISNLIWKFKNLTKFQKTLFIIVLIALIALGFTVYQRYFRPEKIEEQTEEPKKIESPAVTQASTLDGTQVSPDLANRIPLAIMVENHPDARPHSGLDKASIVYEAIAEGGITRFLAVYGPQDAAKVGPVRSARTYYLSWAQEYKALYAHVGGNMDALDQIKAGAKIYDLDQFNVGSKAYWRDKRNVALEHTMFTDTTKLRAVANDKKYPTTGNFIPNTFKIEVEESLRPEAQTINVNFSTNTYAVKWTYDRPSNSYLRFMTGTAHKDAITGRQLSAKNIVIQYVDRKQTRTRINEEGWIFTVVGEGKAKFIQDGKAIDCTWKRANDESRTKFYDASGNEVKFNPGTTWYEIVHNDINITIL